MTSEPSRTVIAGAPIGKVNANQKVVIVNGSPEMLELIETVLDGGHYDVVFVESTEHAYSQVKRVRPDLVILCMRVDDMEGLQVLSMLKLDADTRAIPVLTYAMEQRDQDIEDEALDTAEAEFFAPKPVARMN